MIRRLFVGLVLGLIIGGLVAAALVAGLHVTTFFGGGGTVLAYLAAALTGTLTGLFAGKPIWSSDGKVEAGLKAFFGALIGAGLMFAMRQWAGGLYLDLSAIAPGGAGPVGELPAASLPMIAALLGAFFELDNTGGEGAEKGAKTEKALPSASARKRVAAGANGKAKPRVAAEEELDVGEDANADPPHAKNQ
jgi:hypothetical protein